MESTVTDKIKFLENEYNKADLAGMTDEDLLTLRNTVASNLGVAGIKNFKDHDTAVEQTWKALQKFDETVKSEAGEGGEATTGEKPAKAPKAPKEPKERKLAKPAASQYVKRPTRKMFSKVEIVKQHDGSQDRAHRWPNYKDGMLVIDAIEGEGTLAWDIYNWEAKGLMKVVEPTDAEYAERRAAWYTKHGLEDPDLAKTKKAEEREKAKAAKAEEAAAKKAEREKAKAEKEAAKAAAKAEADAKKAAAAQTPAS